MSSFYHKIILEILLTILCVRCFAQSESCSNSPIQIGVGNTAIYICIDSLFKPNELDSTFVLSYYFINASISVMNIRYYSNLRFFDIKIDTIYDIIPCGWIYNNDSLTICEWKDSAENNNVKTLLKGQHLRMSLQSIIPINFIGHGESSVIVHNKKQTRSWNYHVKR